MKRIVNFLIGTMIMIPIHCVFGQNDTIDIPAKNVLQTEKLSLGKRKYIVYVHNPATPESLFFSLWTRTTEISELNGKKVFVTEEVWRGADSTSYNEIHSVNRFKDFAPIHTKTYSSQGIMAYDWSQNGIKASQNIENNVVKQDFEVNFPKPVLNWHMDIETFEMLPLGPDKIFRINFYDAGSQPPMYVIYKVIGKESISGFDGHKIECWVLQTTESHRGTKISQTFWISKKSHELIKEEDDYGGIIRHKIKLPVASPLPSAIFDGISKL